MILGNPDMYVRRSARWYGRGAAQEAGRILNFILGTDPRAASRDVTWVGVQTRIAFPGLCLAIQPMVLVHFSSPVDGWTTQGHYKRLEQSL